MHTCVPAPGAHPPGLCGAPRGEGSDANTHTRLLIVTQPSWDSCATKRRLAAAAAVRAATGPASSGARRLMEAYGRLKEAAGEEGARQLLQQALLEGAKRAAAAEAA